MAAPVDVAAAVERATGEKPARTVLLKGSGNNVVARVEMREGPLAAKVYFRHPSDPRDRLGTEFGMLSFLWGEGLRSVPRPLRLCREESLGLYEFVEGAPPGAIGAPEMEELASFLGELHDRRGRPGAAGLPAASESAFSLARYVENVEARLGRLRKALEGGSDAQARAFAEDRLAPVLGKVKKFVEARAEKWAMDPGRELEPSQRTLSPADHGFHNTLRRAGRLVFLDFEYAGWDDPAQVVANACLQPAVPLPAEFRERFVRVASARLGGGRDLGRRLRLVWPMLAFKWSLIMLNEFLPVDRERRSFAGANVEERKAAQLEKAKRRLAEAEEALSDGFFLEGKA